MTTKSARTPHSHWLSQHHWQMTMPKSSALINCCCKRGERTAGLQRDLGENIKYDSFNLCLNPYKAASYRFRCCIDTKATYHCRRPDRRKLSWCIGSVLWGRTHLTPWKRKLQHAADHMYLWNWNSLYMSPFSCYNRKVRELLLLLLKMKQNPHWGQTSKFRRIRVFRKIWSTDLE